MLSYAGVLLFEAAEKAHLFQEQNIEIERETWEQWPLNKYVLTYLIILLPFLGITNEPTINITIVTWLNDITDSFLKFEHILNVSRDFI